MTCCGLPSTLVQSNRIGLLPHALHLGFQEHGEAARIDVREALADLLVFALQQSVTTVDYRHLRAQGPKEMAQLSTDVPSTETMRCGCRGSRMMVSEVW